MDAWTLCNRAPACPFPACEQVRGDEYGDDDLDPEWAGLLADLDARLQVRLGVFVAGCLTGWLVGWWWWLAGRLAEVAWVEAAVVAVQAGTVP